MSESPTTKDAPEAVTETTATKGGFEAKPSISAALTVGEIIGEGGMGVVRTALQISLARHVAIKTAHPGASEHAARRMLSEAGVTGYLEHPGVVPVLPEARPLAAGFATLGVTLNLGAIWRPRER